MAAIAEMIAVELGASPDEVARWKELVQRLDISRFEQTGEIVLIGATEGSSDTGVDRNAQYDPNEVRRILNQLRARARAPERRRTIARRGRAPVRMSEPDYNSVENDLWLYGPFS